MSETTSQFQLNSDQFEAIDKIKEWLAKTPPIDPAGLTAAADVRSEFRLGGYAGTGKTTIIRTLLEDDTLTNKYIPAVAAFTGKAVSVLRSKGIPACTLHTLMYHVSETKDERGNSVLELERKITLHDEQNDIKRPTLVIVDEASMMSRELLESLRSYKVRILFVGDPAQLEPVSNEDDPKLMHAPDYTLTTITRQGRESGIIQLSMHARNREPFINGSFGTNKEAVADKNYVGQQHLRDYLTRSATVICAWNRDRAKLNRDARRLLELQNDLAPGDKVIILRNNTRLGVFNGMLLYVTEVDQEMRTRPSMQTPLLDFVAVDDLGTKHRLTMPILPLRTGKPVIPEDQRLINFFNRQQGGRIVQADYGFALTCHKAQGSEWNSVLVFEPSWWGKAGEELFDKHRWRYTAITRAARTLLYCR
jgi:exodeoxyribonuclease-5